MLARTTTRSSPTQPNGCETSSQKDSSRPETLTSDPLSMSSPTISKATRNAISSPASVAGATRSDLQDGPTTDLFGQEVAPASPSQPPGKEKHQAMNATSGPLGSDLSRLADQNESLGNRLKRLLDGVGSTLFTLTWRKKATPLGRPYYQLVASGHSTLDSGCGSWPTPRASLGMSARLTKYGAEKASERRGNLEDKILEFYPSEAVGAFINPRFVSKMMGFPQEWINCAPLEMPSSRKSRQSSSRRRCEVSEMNHNTGRAVE